MRLIVNINKNNRIKMIHLSNDVYTIISGDLINGFHSLIDSSIRFERDIRRMIGLTNSKFRNENNSTTQA